MKSIRMITVLLLAATSIATAGTANATPRLTVDLPSDPVVAGEVVQIPVTLSGLTWTKADVTITSEVGDLTVVDTNSVLTLQPGFNSLVSTEISFFGDTADVVSVLSNSLSWTSPATPSTSLLKFKISISEHVDNQVIDPTSGHSYRFVADEGITWFEAREAAHALTFAGHEGYLVAITSESENNFVATKTDAENVWIGTTSDLETLAALTPSITGNATCGYYWADGSAAGQPTSNGCETPTAVNGSYFAWAEDEPNGANHVEDCGVTNWNESRGSWNDLDCVSDAAAGYLVEFDTSASDFSANSLVFDNLESETLANTGSNLQPAFGLSAIAAILGAILVLSVRRKEAKK